jgi:CRP-like cAMP-binding protein
MKSIGDKRDFIREGSRSTEACLVLEGVACRYKIVPGGRRQILSFHFSGDLPDLQGLHLGVMDHSMAALTPARLAFVPHEPLLAATQLSPSIAGAITRSLTIDGAIFREWITCIGRRTAIERIAHLLCECASRTEALGLTTIAKFILALTQAEIGDATGLSNVHVNRTLQDLRRRKLISNNNKALAILDWEGLQEVAEFDPTYLHLKPEAAQ